MEVKTETVEVAVGTDTMPAYLARPDAGGLHPGVVVVMEAFGLNEHIRDVARRFAAEGFVAVAPDLYYRESGRVVGYEELPEALRLMNGLWDDKVVADMEAAIGYLAAQAGVRSDGIGVTGFCMGGRIAVLTACRSRSVGAVVSFYGGGIASGEHSARRPAPPLDLAAQLGCPVLAFFGSEDPFIPTAEVERVRETLNALGPAHEVVVYDSVPHGFFCNERDSYRPDAASDAWDRALRFFRTHLNRG